MLTKSLAPTPIQGNQNKIKDETNNNYGVNNSQQNSRHVPEFSSGLYSMLELGFKN